MKKKPQISIRTEEMFSPLDWNFDAVPNTELVACCYWEYARESAFIRELRKRCLINWRSGGYRDQQIHTDLEKLQSIGYSSEVFMRGFFFEPNIKYRSVDEELSNHRHPDAPTITGSFPQPWQSLSIAERNSRSHISSDRTAIPLVPFKRGEWYDARDIARWAEARSNEIFSTYRQVQSDNPGASEVELIEKDKLQPFPGVPASLFWAGGSEVTVVAINWADFTNDEIATYFRRWVKANRPKNAKSPSGQGHKPKDWRANLTRLAVMRLLARFTPLEIVDPRRNRFPAIWETKQFAGRKWSDVTKWHDARREAGKLFRKLFPFLPADEKPLSWGRQAPGK